MQATGRDRGEGEEHLQVHPDQRLHRRRIASRLSSDHSRAMLSRKALDQLQLPHTARACKWGQAKRDLSTQQRIKKSIFTHLGGDREGKDSEGSGERLCLTSLDSRPWKTDTGETH